ncbi:hypothetical protein CHLRE_09g400145v5 [Chlamydomonas reinhardtii]|uniref:Uncharacterized protein n=1 Tax=Chlamydomonas reinhardtii TaxID=3055 RepID=A0A2K3DEY1_CHLRE|nr:uncharacterized protein CHLRE_09g400145v5 [Chlamydomonas reinhardtii]PNW79084.1 hypothetical protein CHLRE_09g400145v5 [Chlamydomonas reinhardtii]
MWGVEQHPPQPATQPPAAPPQWRVSLDQLWVANAAGAVSYVHYTGRLLEPGPGVLPPAVDGAWQPACVLQHRKPRHLWTFEERAAYDAASPGERAGAWPRAPYFLAPEAGVVVHPEHCRIAGVSLADYTVRDVRRAITAANPAAPPAPARPAAMPCPAPTQQAGGSGPQPAAQSRLAKREAEWQRAAAQLTTTAAQHFHNNPVALDPWLHRTSAAAGLQNTPARTWLQQLWACVAPQAAAPPVTDAGFMLGDRMGMWASGPRGAGALLWSTLRATFLYAVWCAYWSREPAKQTSEHVVREVVTELRRVMQLRFTAATLTPDTLSALPTQLLTAQLKAAKLEHFLAIWSAGGALCEVEEVRALAGVAAPGRLWDFLHSASCSGLEPA